MKRMRALGDRAVDLTFRSAGAPMLFAVLLDRLQSITDNVPLRQRYVDALLVGLRAPSAVTAWRARYEQRLLASSLLLERLRDAKSTLSVRP